MWRHMIVLGLPIVLWLKAGYLDQYDFWVGTFGLVVFSLVEVVLFAWMFGGDNMWGELRRDADLRVPRVFYYIIRYVVPLMLIGLLAGWCFQISDRCGAARGCAARECAVHLVVAGDDPAGDPGSRGTGRGGSPLEKEPARMSTISDPLYVRHLVGGHWYSACFVSGAWHEEF